MKTKILISFAAIFCLIIALKGCSGDNTTNPSLSDKVVIEETITPSSSTQTFTTDDNLLVKIVAGALEGTLDLKVTKLGSAPKYEGKEFTLGSNVFKAEFGGEYTLNGFIEFRIKYDKSKKPNKVELSDYFYGVKYSGTMWSKADYYLDTETEEIVIRYSGVVSRVKGEVLLSNTDEETFADAMAFDQGKYNGGDYDCDPCNFKVNYSELEIMESPTAVYYMKKGTTIWHGPYILWYDDGRTMKNTCMCYKDGELDGLWTSWYENGNKSAEYTYKDGQKEGLCTIWYENGNKKNEYTLKDGKLEGKWTKWFENGYKYVEYTYKAGKKDGFWTSWYANGKKEEEGYYKDDKKDGKYTLWYENGNIKAEGSYKAGKSDGKYTEWDEDGNKSAEYTFKDGNLDGEYTKWYINGKKEEEGYYKDNNKDGLWTRWYANGKKEEEGYYKDDKKVGEWWLYREDGSCDHGWDYGDGTGNPKYIKCP